MPHWRPGGLSFRMRHSREEQQLQKQPRGRPPSSTAHPTIAGMPLFPNDLRGHGGTLQLARSKIKEWPEPPCRRASRTADDKKVSRP